MSDNTIREQAIEQAASVIDAAIDAHDGLENYQRSLARALADAGLLAPFDQGGNYPVEYKTFDSVCDQRDRLTAEVAKLRAELHNAEMTIDTLSDPVAREILAGNTTEDDWEEATAPHLLTDGGQS